MKAWDRNSWSVWLTAVWWHLACSSCTTSTRKGYRWESCLMEIGVNCSSFTKRLWEQSLMNTMVVQHVGQHSSKLLAAGNRVWSFINSHIMHNALLVQEWGLHCKVPQSLVPSAFWACMSLCFKVVCVPLLKTSYCKDFRVAAQISDRLLHHFSQTWKDREVYWCARERAKIQRDLCVCILDSYDHAKLSLPAWPMRRCPKRAVYENTRSALLSLNSICWNMLKHFETNAWSTH